MPGASPYDTGELSFWCVVAVRRARGDCTVRFITFCIMYAAHPHTARRDGSREHCYLSVSTIMNHPIMQTFEHWSLPMAWAEGSERPPLRRLPNRPPLGSEQESRFLAQQDFVSPQGRRVPKGARPKEGQRVG